MRVLATSPRDTGLSWSGRTPTSGARVVRFRGPGYAQVPAICSEPPTSRGVSLGEPPNPGPGPGSGDHGAGGAVLANPPGGRSTPLSVERGAVAEWLGSGLQIRAIRFDSGRRLHPSTPHIQAGSGSQHPAAQSPVLLPRGPSRTQFALPGHYLGAARVTRAAVATGATGGKKKERGTLEAEPPGRHRPHDYGLPVTALARELKRRGFGGDVGSYRLPLDSVTGRAGRNRSSQGLTR